MTCSHRHWTYYHGICSPTRSHSLWCVLQQGHEVTVLDNFFTGRKQNIEHWIGHPNFRLVMHDVVDPFMMEVCNRTPFKNVPPPLRPTPAYIVHSLLLPAHHCNDRTSHVDGKHQVDEIYHLASPASPPHYMYNPIKTIKTNSQGTLNMLGLARRVNARMLLASTSEVRIASFGPT